MSVPPSSTARPRRVRGHANSQNVVDDDGPEWRAAVVAAYPAYGQVPLECKQDPQKGWAVYAGQAIKKHAFVLEYAGVLRTQADADEQHEIYAHKHPDVGSYMFDFYSYGVPYCIDATIVGGATGGGAPGGGAPSEPPQAPGDKGGLGGGASQGGASQCVVSQPDMQFGMGRYLNHSRNAYNLYVTLKHGTDTGGVAPLALDRTCPRLCFFAKRNIVAGDELTFNYGDRSRDSRANFAWL